MAAAAKARSSSAGVSVSLAKISGSISVARLASATLNGVITDQSIGVSGGTAKKSAMA